MQTAVILILTCIPALYAFIYLYAYWDPTEYSANISIAVVNLDEGEVINDTYQNIGDSIVDTLQENTEINWVFTDKNDAKNGVLDGKYYGELLIPEDFSACIATAAKDSKTQGTLYFTANDKFGTVASSLLKNVSANIEDEVSASVTESLVNAITDKTQSIPDSLQELSDSLVKLDYGSTQLSEGLSSLIENQEAFNQKLGSLASALDSAAVNSRNINAAVDELALSPGLSGQLDQLTEGVFDLSEGLNTLSAASNLLSEKSTLFLSADTELRSGINQLNGGIETIQSAVDESTQELKMNTASLSNYGLYAAIPIQMVTSKIGDTENNGTAMTPFIASLCMWLGGIMLIIVFTTIDRFKFHEFKSSEKLMVDLGLFRFQLLGALQALCLGFTIHQLLGLEIENVLQFYGILILASITFVTIIQLLVLIFQDFGKLLSIIFMLLQLTACGGILSTDLIPAFYKSIHNFMPMTYSVNALRNIILVMNTNDFQQSIIILGTTLAAGVFLVLLISLMQHVARKHKTKKTLAFDGDGYLLKIRK